MIQLTQKTFTVRKEIHIETGCLLVRSKSIREDLEYRIKLEELGFDIVKKRIKTANIPFYAFLLFDIFYIGLLIASVINHESFQQQLFWLFALLFFSAMTVAAYYNRNKDVIYLTGGQKVLELLAAKPDVDTVNTFIRAIHQAMRQHFKTKYSQFDRSESYEFRMHQLKWLKEIQAITEEEYDDLADKAKADTIIGY